MIGHLRKHRLHWVLVCGSALAGALTATLLPPAPTRTDDRNGDEQWSLPSADSLVRYRDIDSAQVRRSRFWATPSTAAPESKLEWRFVGVVREANQLVGLLLASDDSVRRVRSGEPLEDGARILEIEPTAITIESNGCQSVRRLYQPTSSTELQCTGSAGDSKNGSHSQ